MIPNEEMCQDVSVSQVRWTQRKHKQLASRLVFCCRFLNTNLLPSQLEAAPFCRCQFELAPSPFAHALEVPSPRSCGRDGSVKHACESHPRHLSLHYFVHYFEFRLSVAAGDATCIIHTCGCVWKTGRVPARLRLPSERRFVH